MKEIPNLAHGTCGTRLGWRPFVQRNSTLVVMWCSVSVSFGMLVLIDRSDCGSEESAVNLKRTGRL